MAIAYWCIIIALWIPMILAWISKYSTPGLDNSRPREWVSEQTNPRILRASAAQQNSYEALIMFVAAVFMAQFAGIGDQWIAAFSAVFIVVRIVYCYLYLSNKPSLRSAVWMIGFLTVLAMMLWSAVELTMVSLSGEI